MPTFPTTFPADDLQKLIDYFKDREAHSTRDYAEAAWSLEGYALGQGFAAPKTTATEHAHSTPVTDEEKIAVLQQCKTACVPPEPLDPAKAGAKTAAPPATAVPWSLILSIVMNVLQQLGPLLGK